MKQVNLVSRQPDARVRIPARARLGGAHIAITNATIAPSVGIGAVSFLRRANAGTEAR
jgi:hypothetical protein